MSALGTDKARDESAVPFRVTITLRAAHYGSMGSHLYLHVITPMRFTVFDAPSKEAKAALSGFGAEG